jgi:hypothetical protein
MDLELLEFAFFSFGGWRFVLSRRFRERTLARWAEQRQMQTMQEIVGALIGMALTVLVPFAVWAGLR